MTGADPGRRSAWRARASTGLLRRLHAGTGVGEVSQLQRRVDLVAEAVEENAALEVPLAALVADLERSLVAPLEHRLRMLGIDPPAHREL